MRSHVTHYYWESGWPDDYVAGCHLETYEKHSRKWGDVTCKHCLRNEKKQLAEAELIEEPTLEKDSG